MMNVKFFLTIALSFGCVIMLFLWYSASGIHKESQLYEKQFLFKISTLESENKMELRLINSLRVEIAKNDEDLKIKTNLLETMRNKDKSRGEERENLQKDIEVVKARYETVNKENNMWLENWKIESQKKSESDKNKIKQLEDELQTLKAEYNRLIQLIPSKPVITEASSSPSKDLKSNNNDNENTVGKPIESKNVTDTLKKTESSNHNKSHEVQPKKVEIDNQIRQARPPKIDRPDESHVLQKMISAENVSTIVNKDKKIEVNDKVDHVKLENKADKMSVDNGQIIKPKVLPIQKLKLDENMFLQNKDESKIDKRNPNPKILKKEAEHQVRPPIPIKKMDKTHDDNSDNSVRNDDVMNVLNKPYKKRPYDKKGVME